MPFQFKVRPFLAPAVLAAAFAVSACQEQTAQRAPCPAGQVCLEWGNNIEAGTLDPQKANLIDEAAIIGDLFNGLTTEDPRARPIPAMAERWEVSPDGLTWTFHLREATWSDGKPVTAEDFVYAYHRLLAPETASIYAYMAFVLKNGQALSEQKVKPQALGARALGPRTLELTLDHPAPYLPELLKHQSFFPVPKHAVEKFGDAWIQPKNFVGNGPFVLKEWRLGDHTRVVKNPRYWDAANVCVDQIRYYPTPDTVSAERRVKSGELDLNTQFDSNRIDRLRKEMGPYVRTHVTLATSYLSFNTRDFAPFKDVRVRRALSMAVDREFITEKIARAGQSPAYSFVPPIMANYKAGAALRWKALSYPERQAEARRLLAQAGYGPDRPLVFEAKVANSPGTLILMQAIQADWRLVGVDAKIAQNEGQIAFAAYRLRDFQIGSMSWYADYNDPVNFLDLMRASTGAQNYGDYNNPAYDALLDQANHEPDGEKRADILMRAEQLMLDDEATIPVYFQVNRALVSPRVTGWVDNEENYHRARWLCVKG